MSSTLQEREESLQARAEKSDVFVDITGTLWFWLTALSFTYPLTFCLLYFSDEQRRIQNSLLLAVMVSSGALITLSLTKLLIVEVAAHDYRKVRENPLGYFTMQSLFKTYSQPDATDVSALVLVISVVILTATWLLVPDLDYQPLFELLPPLRPD